MMVGGWWLVVGMRFAVAAFRENKHAIMTYIF
jgi:hypothetical protein